MSCLTPEERSSSRGALPPKGDADESSSTGSDEDANPISIPLAPRSAALHGASAKQKKQPPGMKKQKVRVAPPEQEVGDSEEGGHQSSSTERSSSGRSGSEGSDKRKPRRRRVWQLGHPLEAGQAPPGGASESEHPPVVQMHMTVDGSSSTVTGRESATIPTETETQITIPLPPVSIEVIPPDTAANFMEFNVPCEQLDSDHLMMPINEADYDSETQACYDSRTGGPSSFYSHYTTKRKKKRGRKGPIEKPLKGPGSIPGALDSAEGQQQPTNPDLLFAPSSGGVPKGVLSNAAVRKIACGVLPPTSVRPKLAPTGWKTGPPPSYPGADVTVTTKGSAVAVESLAVAEPVVSAVGRAPNGPSPSSEGADESLPVTVGSDGDRLHVSGRASLLSAAIEGASNHRSHPNPAAPTALPPPPTVSIPYRDPSKQHNHNPPNRKFSRHHDPHRDAQ